MYCSLKLFNYNWDYIEFHLKHKKHKKKQLKYLFII